MGTKWELHGNNTNPAPHLPLKEKKTESPGCILPHLIGCKVFCLKKFAVFAILGLGFSKFGSISCFTASQTVGRLAALQQNILNKKILPVYEPALKYCLQQYFCIHPGQSELAPRTLHPTGWMMRGQNLFFSFYSCSHS